LYRDPPLTENGSGQAYQLGAALTGRILKDMNLNPKIAAVYSSPFYDAAKLRLRLFKELRHREISIPMMINRLTTMIKRKLQIS
jgi:broad specificity phosphatase PhoE